MLIRRTQVIATWTTVGGGAYIVNHISTSVYDVISECKTCEEAIAILHIKPKNEVYARHLLLTTKQESGENLDQYFQKLKNLAKDCNYKAASSEICRDESIRDALIRGLRSAHVRQRLLEGRTTDQRTIFEQARSLKLAQEQLSSY